MDPKPTDDLLRRPLYLYDLPGEVLATLTLVPDPSIAIADATPGLPSQEISRSSSTENLVGSQSCSLCGQTFASVLDQRSHQKSDLHNYNLKQKLRGLKPVSESEFEKLIGDLDESLSGSDSSSDSAEDSEEEDGKGTSTLTALLKKQATLAEREQRIRSATEDAEEDDDAGVAKRRQRGTGKPPLLWFSSSVLPANTYFGIYRAVFTSEEVRNKKEEEIVEVVKRKQLQPLPVPKLGPDGLYPAAVYKAPHIFLCMIGGGHFGAMFISLAPRQSQHSTTGPLNREATVLAHKTFHRYTTRRKQGGSQSTKDNTKGGIHSAGSSLRRYNEQALTDEVRELLFEWKGLLETSELLFIRATGAVNRRTLFGPYEGQVLRANDTRIRGFPFSTRRATQHELMRSFIELTRLKVREFDPNQVQISQAHPVAKGTPSKPAKAAAPKLSEEEETALLHTSQLQAFVRRSKLPALLSYLQRNEVPADFMFQPADQNHHAPTCLHLSASQNSAPLVLGLLVKAGADPTIENAEGKMPFELAGTRATRDAFRVARHELGEKWDWEKAKIPPAMSRDEADKRDERERKESEKKEAERRRAEEARLRTQSPKLDDKVRKGVLGGGLQKSAQEKREEEARGLTPEQRMKLDRERRARAAEERIRRMQTGNR